MKKISTFLLDIYKKLFSGFIESGFSGGCRFYPPCSDYSKEAIEKHGIFRGLLLSLKRMLKCHPFGGSGVDFVPEKYERIF